MIWAVAALALAACKPTEQNYKAAYDAAQAKVVDNLRDTDAEHRRVQDDEFAFAREFQGDTVLQSRQSVKCADIDATKTPFAVGVALFKMPANAHSRAADLKKSGVDAYVGEDAEARFAVLVHPSATFAEVAVAAKTFRKLHPDFPYVGLRGEPVVFIVR